MGNKGIAVYGSTGSIGKQTLEVVKEIGGFDIVALCCNSSVDVIFDQIKEFHPRYAAVIEKEKAEKLQKRVDSEKLNTKVFAGVDGAVEACGDESVDTVLNSAVGISGLIPTIALIKKGKNIALANKETMVTGGDLVTKLAKENNVMIYPVDSEHSAIFQALQGNERNNIEKIILTASGGPFRGKKREDMKNVTVEQALKHPNWNMGSKITIDSATLMNKGLEIIEAKWLFDVPQEKIEVVVHPQSIIHSAIQYEDGSVMAQMGTPDMRTPIQYALTYPKRIKNNFPRLELFGKSINFEYPDYDTFKCLAYARKALARGENFTTVVNGANEKAVELFLNKKIGFLDVMDLVESAYINYNGSKDTLSIDAIQSADKWAREHVAEKANGISYAPLSAYKEN